MRQVYTAFRPQTSIKTVYLRPYTTQPRYFPEAKNGEKKKRREKKPTRKKTEKRKQPTKNRRKKRTDGKKKATRRSTLVCFFAIIFFRITLVSAAFGARAGAATSLQIMI